MAGRRYDTFLKAVFTEVMKIYIFCSCFDCYCLLLMIAAVLKSVGKETSVCYVANLWYPDS